MHKTMAILVKVKELARGSDVGIGIIISSVTKQAGNSVNPTWPFYFEEIFCVSYICWYVMLYAHAQEIIAKKRPWQLTTDSLLLHSSSS